MMGQLIEKEWLTVNEIIKDIYAAESLYEMEESFLLLIRKLVPYKIAAFSIVNDDFTVDENKTIIIGDETGSIQTYNEKYVKHDYTNDILTFPKSTVYSDEDIIDHDKKKQTIFYREWLKPNQLDYSGGVFLHLKKDKKACITMFRSDLYGQLKEKELFILELFIGHLENILENLLNKSAGNHFDPELIKGYELLTARECEILPFILKGYTNNELAEKFSISDSTAKKHVYNILVKLNAKSRGELIRKCSE